ncbi:DUF6348 family protein [Dysgonomonas gadei]|uniref:Uncharacterized protein n=2 Tax=Dysgonomonas gadei TaxID=156974 RepID=F5J0L7_9BACT|nr:DUF6348 family protein [Dysgonomonas gadei]EGK00610.1 hypothetical protein HMPREF9455_02884 [Dysgonomonas gadei ATCC BAA-286]
MNDNKLIQHELQLNNFLAETFRRHNIECNIEKDLIIFPHQYMTAWAHIFNRSSSSMAVILQLDIHLEIGLGKTIIESCAGMGVDENTAIKDAWKNFLTNSFHTLLSAFFTKEFDHQVNNQQWVVDGRTYNVTISNVTTRGSHPDPLPLRWLEQLEETIKVQPLTEGTHWVRFYYAQSESELISGEILLDNEVWTGIEKFVRTFDFPTYKDFFSMRVFMVLKDHFDISRMAATMAWMVGEDDDAIEQQLMAEGLSLSDAEKANTFIPLAFGRVFLKGITTAKFSDEAIVTDETEKEATIKLSDEPIYTSAYQLAEKIIKEGCVNQEHFQNLFIQSAEFNAYNNALKDGAKAEDMNNARFGEPVIYMPHYQPAEKKEETTENIIPEKTGKEKKKPSWKFWKK